MLKARVDEVTFLVDRLHHAGLENHDFALAGSFPMHRLNRKPVDYDVVLLKPDKLAHLQEYFGHAAHDITTNGFRGVLLDEVFMDAALFCGRPFEVQFGIAWPFSHGCDDIHRLRTEEIDGLNELSLEDVWRTKDRLHRPKDIEDLRILSMNLHSRALPDWHHH
jgi:hypothetical protein